MSKEAWCNMVCVFVTGRPFRVFQGHSLACCRQEDLWTHKIHAARQEADIVAQWMLFKANRTNGPKSDYDYVAVHLFDSWGKLETPYPPNLFQDLSFTDEEQKIIKQTGASRKLIRTELWSLRDAAVADVFGQREFDDVIQLGFMKSKNLGRHQALERDVWKKVWKKAVEDGWRVNWLLWNCRYPGGTQYPFNMVAIHLMPENKPDDQTSSEWWETAQKEVFPDRTPEEREEILTNTREARDIPIAEEWTIVRTLDIDN